MSRANARLFLEEFESSCKLSAPVPPETHSRLILYASADHGGVCNRETMLVAIRAFAAEWRLPLTASLDPDIWGSDGDDTLALVAALRAARRDRESLFSVIPNDILELVVQWLRPPEALWAVSGIVRTGTISVSRIKLETCRSATADPRVPRHWSYSRTCLWERTPPLPNAHVAGAAVAFNGGILVGGGQPEASSVASLVIEKIEVGFEPEQWYYFNPASLSGGRRDAALWKPFGRPNSQLPCRRQFFGAAVRNDGELFTFGGCSWSHEPLATAFKFCSVGGDWQWIKIEPLPVPLISCAAAVLPNGFIFVAGRNRASGCLEAFLYDAGANSYVHVTGVNYKLSALAADRAAAATAASEPDNNFSPVLLSKFLSRPDVVSCVVLARRIWIFTRGLLLAYNLADDLLQRIPIPKKAGRVGCRMVALDDSRLLLTGGIEVHGIPGVYDESPSATADVGVYDVVRNKWEDLPELYMLTRLAFHSLVVV